MTGAFPPLPAWRWPTPRPALPLETPRLLLRPYVERDAAALHALVRASEATLLPWLPWASAGHDSVAASAAFIALCTEAHGAPEPEMVTYGVFRRDSGALTGGIGLARARPGDHSLELGYWLGTEHTGQGICTEAARHVVSFAFEALGLHRIRVCCALPNEGSVRVIERLGARHEATFLRSRYYAGLGWVDRVEYALLAEEWDPQAHARQAP